MIPSVHLQKTLDASHRTPLGGLIENILMNALFSETTEVSGWKKSSSGSEVDFIVKKGDQIIPLECKAALSIKNTHLGGVIDFLKIHNLRFGIVVGLAPFEIRKIQNDSLMILPLYLAERWEEVVSRTTSPGWRKI